MKWLLNLAKSEYIYFCDKPLPQAKPHEIKKVTIAEANALFAKRRNLAQFNWSSDFYVPDEWQLTEEDKYTLASLEKQQIPDDKFVVCFINDEVGYGVFAREDIAEKSIIFYGGKVIPKSDKDASYGYSYNDGSILDGFEIGAYTPLFQDLYPPTIPLDDNWSMVARNNFTSMLLPLSCGSLTYLRATTQIKAGMQCGQNYGRQYWKVLHIKSNISKQYFDLNGECIKDSYQKDFLAINELTSAEVEAIRQDLPVNSALDASSLEKYAPISALARKIVGVIKTPPVTDKVEKKITSSSVPSFFKKVEPIDTLRKYQQDSANNAGIAFRQASFLGNVVDMQIIIDAYAININEQSSNGMTALHWAYENNHTKAVNWLLGQKEIKLNIKDNLSRTPLDCATKKRPAKKEEANKLAYR